MDISASMDREEFALQRRGYVAAIRHPEFVQAVESGRYGRIAVSYVEWSESRLQRIVVPWRLIDGAAAAEAFAGELAGAELKVSRGTSISAALLFGADHFDANAYEGARRVIDVSGDGPNNFGRPVTEARAEVVGRGVTINGLPILIRPSGIFPDMDRYYRDCVIGGPGAFSLPVTRAADFATAIRRKLVLEVAGLPPARVMPVAERAPVDCLVGERAIEKYVLPSFPVFRD